MTEKKRIYRPVTHERILSLFGEVNESEKEILCRYRFDFAKGCILIAEQQTSLAQTYRWLGMGADSNTLSSDKARTTEVILKYIQQKSNQRWNDEIALSLGQVKEKDEHFNYAPSFFQMFEPYRRRSYRCLRRLLFSGSLKRNRTSPLYHSFFYFGMRDPRMVPIIVDYVLGRSKKRKGSERDRPEPGNEDMDVWERPVRTKEQFRYFVLPIVNDVSSFSDIFEEYFLKDLPLNLCGCTYVEIDYDNQMARFLSLILFCFGGNEKLCIVKGTKCKVDRPYFDLSSIKHSRSHHLEHIRFSGITIPSISPFAHTDLSSLVQITFGSLCESESIVGLTSLNGLTKENTKNIKKLFFNCPDLKDISALSSCSLPCLTKIYFDGCSSLSDLSPLRGKDFSSLEKFSIGNTAVSDISPLCDCKGFPPPNVWFEGTLIEDLSPLCRMDLSRLEGSVSLQDTKISDLSPLENISYENVCLNIHNTPAAEKMKEDGLESPQMIGMVNVAF